jgi:hypothetical protein
MLNDRNRLPSASAITVATIQIKTETFVSSEDHRVS